MWLDADSGLDLYSEEGRTAMVLALEEAEKGPAWTPPPTLSTVQTLAAGGHSYHSGAPYLRCSVPWGLQLLGEANRTHPALGAASSAIEALHERSELTVSVDWGSLVAEQLPGVVQLTVRRAGEQIGVADGYRGAPLSITSSVRGAAAGEVFVAALRWAGGSRHLHCHAPLLAPIRLDGLSAPPPSSADAPPPSGDALTRPSSDEGDGDDDKGGAPPPPLLCLPDRGVGVELELITMAPVPTSSGCFTKGEELAALIREVRRRHAAERAGAGAEVGGDRPYDPLPLLLARCALWRHQVDDHVGYASAEVAERTAAAATAAAAAATAAAAAAATEAGRHACEEQQQQREKAQQQKQLEELHAGGAGTMKSEFTSPLPSEGGALNFGRSGAAELACFVRLVRHLGAAAPALSATANGGCCSMHVHVNTRSAVAGGDMLSVPEILNVYFAWVAYDLVTARFARPWVWREPSAAPLYATGAEFAWHEKAWEQGHATMADRGASTYDVPEFLRAVHALCRDEGFAALSDAEQLEALFGRTPDAPASRIGRYCSLNLRKLTTYGTLEFRRFHGTLDAALAVRWAHFCVAFVERFRRHGLGERLLHRLPIDEALAELVAAQEAATAPALMEAMAGLVDPSTAEYFMRGSGAQQTCGDF